MHDQPKMVGYWDAPWWVRLDLPRPHHLICVGWRMSERDKIVEYLRNGAPCNTFLGFAECRLCHELLGSRDLTDGEWVWPERLEHYIIDHQVALPDIFVDSMRTRGWRVSHRTKVSATYKYEDFSFWREWAAHQLVSLGPARRAENE